jgi:hypothetical protein
MFVVVFFPFSFSSKEPASGFSASALGPLQREFLASLNPRTFEVLFHRYLSFRRILSGNFVPGVIAAVGINPETPAERLITEADWLHGPWVLLFGSNNPKTIATSAGKLPVSMGNRFIEYLARDSTGTEPWKYFGQEGRVHWGMRYLSGPGVLETLNPTDDGTFGKCRNTYEEKF